MQAIVDCNSFYCSCERLFQPQLKQAPIVVLSNNDGCIVSRSDEAKQLGIAMAVPYFQAKELIEKNKVHAFSSNATAYNFQVDILLFNRRTMQCRGELALLRTTLAGPLRPRGQNHARPALRQPLHPFSPAPPLLPGALSVRHLGRRRLVVAPLLRCRHHCHLRPPLPSVR